MNLKTKASFAFRSGWNQPPVLEPANSFVPKESEGSAPGGSPGGYPAVAGQSGEIALTPAGFAPVQGVAVDGAEIAETAEEEFVAPSLHFEGWLGKLSTGKISRWQRRYFVLEGRRLQYYASPKDPAPKKRLDLRVVHTVRAKTPADARCRILELHLSNGKVRQMRADDPASMRQWLQFVEAARLLEGRFDAEDGAEDGELSDGDSGLSDGWETASTTSSADSLVSLASQPQKLVSDPTKTKNVVSGPSQAKNLVSDATNTKSTVCDSAVDSASACKAFHSETTKPQSKLDKQRASLSTQSHQQNQQTGNSTDASSPCANSAPRRSKSVADCPESIPDMPEIDVAQVDKNLEAWFRAISDRRRGTTSHSTSAVRGCDVMQGLWKALGDTANCPGPHGAVAALDMRGDSSETLNDAIEMVISEFLARLNSRVSLFLDDANLPSEEVEEIISWWLLDAKSCLEAFEQDAVAKSWHVSAWRQSAEEIERSLLYEWEVRCCEELHPTEQPTSQQTNIAHDRISKVDMLLKPKMAVQQVEKWASNTLARDRAVNVLMASLNAALRTGRQSLLSLLPQSPEEEVSSTTRRGLPRWLRSSMRRLSKRSARGAPASTPSVGPEIAMEGAAALVCDAAALATFCSRALSRISKAAGCAGVLGALSGAFGQLCSEACNVLADAVVSQEICTVRFNSRDLQEASQHGLLAPSVASVEALFRQAFRNASEKGTQHAASKVVARLARHWIQAFVQAKPRLASCPSLPAAIKADEMSLRTLAYHWGANESEAVAPLSLVRELLGRPSPELQAHVVKRLQHVLGDDLAASVETVVRGCLR